MCVCVCVSVCQCQQDNSTRHSAIADKPRATYAFVQYAMAWLGMAADPLKHAFRHVLPRRIWSFYTSKAVNICRDTPNWGALEDLLLVTGHACHCVTVTLHKHDRPHVGYQGHSIVSLVGYQGELNRCLSNSTSVRTKIRRKNWTHTPRLSRSLVADGMKRSSMLISY